MAQDLEQSFKKFNGIKNDEDPKQIAPDSFTNVVNFRFPETGLLGFDMIKFPTQINQIGTAAIDGLFEYKYLDTNNVLQTQYIAVTDGKIYKDALTSETLLKSGLTAGRCSFVTFQDKLFIANGKNYIQVYYGSSGIISEMGAPTAVVSSSGAESNPQMMVDVGTHYYAMTYVTVGGEEVLGSVSNVVTTSAGGNQFVTLTLPIGYDGTLARNIYRTEAGGTTLKLIAVSQGGTPLGTNTIPDNTTTTYIDKIADRYLSTPIGASNNELPKPYFVTVANQKLYATKVDKYPTQLFQTTTNNEVIDNASFYDLANYGDDNTAIQGIGFDYNKIIVGTLRNIIFVDPATNDIVRTRCYVGIKDGYSMKLVPSFGDFPGGMMFVSSLNDVRLIEGTQAAAVFQTIDNIRTDNWAQDIRGSLYDALASYTNIASEFHDNRYILVVDRAKFCFDIRTKSWTTEHIKSATYESIPRCFAVMSGDLYNGQLSGGWIEKEYQELTYKTESVTARLTSAYLNVDRTYKWLKKIVFWFKSSLTSTTTLGVTLDDNSAFTTGGTFILNSGVYNPNYFDSAYFLVTTGSDYRIVNINNPCRWAQFTLTCTSGIVSFLGWSMVGQAISNKEG